MKLIQGYTFEVLKKWSVILFSILCWCSAIHSQNSLQQSKITKGNTYALIIGISDYQDGNIKDLSFAHKDAKAFADYLTSNSGGKVANENIKMLINDQATISNIYTAKREIENKLKNGDLFYFYFSGHGDVEDGLYKLGFLLAYDTPFKNYYSNAVRIEDINMMANTLSVIKNVKVVLISDACHSGKLAGSDNRNSALVGEQLAKAEKNEVRLASCEADQLSQEGIAWGGGRGVFSYYLINGLIGQADDEDKDGIITIQEIKTFLENKVSKDVSKLKQQEQIPVVKGKSLSPIAIVDEDEFKALANNVNLNTTQAIAAKSVLYEPSMSDRYFSSLSKQSLLQLITFSEWKLLKPKKLIDLALQKLKFCEDKNITESQWKKDLKNDKVVRHQYSQNLAAAMHNEAQQILNPYVSGRVIQITNKDSMAQICVQLDNCADMLEVAGKLMDKDNELHNIIEVKEHFTKGLSARLKIPFSSNPDSLITIAIKEQKIANSIDKRVGFVRSEMSYEYTITTTPATHSSKKKTIIKKNNKTKQTIKSGN